MATEKQMAANRLNAQQSTGPRTDAGKAISRENALRHGLTAQQVFLPGEDSALFDRLRQELYDEHQPVCLKEEIHIHALAAALWRLQRVPAFEAAVVYWSAAYMEGTRHDRRFQRDFKDRYTLPALDENNRALHERRVLGRAIDGALSKGDLFSKLARHEAHIMRVIERNLDALQRAKTERQSRRSTSTRASETPPHFEITYDAGHLMAVAIELFAAWRNSKAPATISSAPSA